MADAKLAPIRRQLDEFFDSKKYYEAQQVMKTLSARYINRKQYDTALYILSDGAKQLATHAQLTAAIDIALQWIDAMNKAQRKPDQAAIEFILEILQLLPKTNAKTSEPLIGFIKQTIKWTSDNSANATPSSDAPSSNSSSSSSSASASSDLSSSSFAHSHGHPSLHYQLAKLYEGEGEWGLSHLHFLRSQKEEEHLLMMNEWLKKIPSSEHDIFLLRTVLQYICVGDLKAANFMWKKLFEGIKKNTPAIHFAEFLLKVVERSKEAAPLFDVLRTKYQLVISRDPTLNSYLDRIGEIYFGQQKSQGLFDLFK